MKKHKDKQSDDESEPEFYDSITDEAGSGPESGVESGSEHSSTHEMQLKISDDKEPKDFNLSDVMSFVKKGIEAIVDDEVTKRFAAEGESVYTKIRSI